MSTATGFYDRLALTIADMDGDEIRVGDTDAGSDITVEIGPAGDLDAIVGLTATQARELAAELIRQSNKVEGVSA